MPKCYQFGISAILSGEELVSDQIWLNHRYRNRLVEIERERRAKRDGIVSRYVTPGLADQIKALGEKMKDIRANIKSANSASRSKKGGTPEQKDMLRALQSEMADLKTRLKTEKKSLRESGAAQGELGVADAEAKACIRHARANCGVYWGTYLLAEAAIKQASKKSSVNYKRFDGSGSVAVQIQASAPLSTTELFGSDTRVQIDEVDPRAWDLSVGRGIRRQICKAELRLRVGSDGRAPVWATFRLHLHRPLPEGQVKWVKVHRRKIANKYQWRCDIIVDSTTTMAAQERVTRRCAIDIGWRSTDSGLKVATLVDDQGHHEVLTLPSSIVRQRQKVNDLESIRQKSFNFAMNSLRMSLADFSGPLPEWLKEEKKYFHIWKSEIRLAKLCLKWRENRFRGDEEIYAQVEAWRKQDKHLWTWEYNLRQKFQLHRRELYRVWSKSLATCYDEIIIEDLDLRQFAEKAPAESDTGEDKYSRIYRTDAALSVLRECLNNAAARWGATVVKRDPHLTSVKCSSCGRIDAWDNPAKPEHTCSECLSTWNRDENACKNLLSASGKVIKKSPDSLAIA